MGTAEVESALVAHPKVAEAAVVGFPHDIKGQGIYAFVTLMTGASLWEAGTVALVEPAINGVWFYVLHRIWKSFNENK